MYILKYSDYQPALKYKTFADDFFEKFPNAPTLGDGLPRLYVCDVYIIHPECFGCDEEQSRKCWLLPYSEQDANA